MSSNYAIGLEILKHSRKKRPCQYSLAGWATDACKRVWPTRPVKSLPCQQEAAGRSLRIAEDDVRLTCVGRSIPAGVRYMVITRSSEVNSVQDRVGWTVYSDGNMTVRGTITYMYVHTQRHQRLCVYTPMVARRIAQIQSNRVKRRAGSWKQAVESKAKSHYISNNRHGHYSLPSHFSQHTNS